MKSQRARLKIFSIRPPQTDRETLFENNLDTENEESFVQRLKMLKQLKGKNVKKNKEIRKRVY